ncbi:helicase-related protein [Pseudoduganella sp. HUAS MS19]
MRFLAGYPAFKALRDALGDAQQADDFTCQDVPFERLRRALLDQGLTPLDRALRLRHALRYAEFTLAERGERLTLPIPMSNEWPDKMLAANCGLYIGAGKETEALPWVPDWLPAVGQNGVDRTGMRAEARRWTNRLPDADPWLAKTFHHGLYKGPGQALAIRSALQMPADQTLLAVMPTGEGKSLVFQSLAAAHPDQVVAVVVPTVALALAHSDSVSQSAALKPEFGHAYVGGNASGNASIISRIPSGEQGLIFAAPEAFVGRLHKPLLDAARNGRLAAFVIDEAHLVDAWGADFRNEFQLLGALVAELRNAAPLKQQPKVVCLSATVTQEAFDSLQALISPGRALSLIAGARLRPEIETWIAPMADHPAVREQRVLEALAHLPRPAILYVTRQEDADAWYDRLKCAGYGRVRVLHGGTSHESRNDVVQAWRRGELDLVVGTSAFGLGIDYPHVRAVVHACVPESLDRYYQEIGRAGRDNHAGIG